MAGAKSLPESAESSAAFGTVAECDGAELEPQSERCTILALPKSAGLSAEGGGTGAPRGDIRRFVRSSAGPPIASVKEN